MLFKFLEPSLIFHVIIEIKGAFVLASGLRGFSLYEAGGDSVNATLLTALRLGAGFPDPNLPSNSTTNSTSTSTSSVSQYDWSYAHNSTVVTTGANSTSTQIGALDWQQLLQSAVDELELALDGSGGMNTGDDTGTGSNSTVATTASTPISTTTAGGSANPYIPLIR